MGLSELVGSPAHKAVGDVCLFRYLDNVVNKQTAAPPIPHLHARLTSGEDPPAEIDIFSLIKSSYEVGEFRWHASAYLPLNVVTLSLLSTEIWLVTF